MSLMLVTPPAVVPVSLSEFQAHLRVSDYGPEDNLLIRLLRVATSRAERELRRALITQTWKVGGSAFPCGTSWRLPKPPLVSVTWVKYLDAASVEQTMDAADYVVDLPSGPNATHGHIVLADGASWPEPGVSHPMAVSAQYIAGYGATASSVPEDIRHGILLLAAHLYEMREPVAAGTTATPIPMTVEYLWSPYRAMVWS